MKGQKASGSGWMEPRSPQREDSIFLKLILQFPCALKLLCVNVACPAAGSGEITSPTAMTEGTRTVWSSGTMLRGTETGMMSTAMLTITGCVRCRFGRPRISFYCSSWYEGGRETC